MDLIRPENFGPHFYPSLELSFGSIHRVCNVIKTVCHGHVIKYPIVCGTTSLALDDTLIYEHARQQVSNPRQLCSIVSDELYNIKQPWRI